MSENNNNINYGIDKLTESFRTIINSYSLTSQMLENMTKPIKIMAERMAEMSKAITNAIMITKINYTPFFDELGKVLQKVKENPDSMFNWIEYSRKLSDYIWTIPYGIDSKQLKEIFEQVNSESEFDAYMRRYYKKTVVQDMIKDIKEMLPKKHEQIFNQIEMAYNNKMYALSIVGMMSIIDELCAYFINDKGTSARMNMFQPIIDDMDEKEGISYYLIDVMILSNNINTIYENVDFNKKIKISSQKKARRNPCQHGRSYSNRKTDAIMLLNTIFNLLVFQNVGRTYKDCLIYNKNKKIFSIKNS